MRRRRALNDDAALDEDAELPFDVVADGSASDDVVDVDVGFVVFVVVVGFADAFQLLLAGRGTRGSVASGDLFEFEERLLFGVRLAMIEIIEITDNDGHGQSYGQNAGNGAQRTNQFPPHSHRTHVAVAYGGHGYDRPPKRPRDTFKLSLWVIGVGEKDRRRK